jgi:hypothetical protein
LQRFGEVVKLRHSSVDLTCSTQAIQSSYIGQGCQYGHWSASIGHFDCFASLDESQQFTCALTQFPNTDRSHVLLVAHVGQLSNAGAGDR